MDKRTELKTALTDAMKSKDEVGTATLRLIMAGVKDRDIEARSRGNADGIGEAEILSMLQSMIKQRQESAETYVKANRPELAAREEAEIVVIRKFLPKQMDDAEVRAVIDGLAAELGVSGIRDMGKLMGALKARYAGQLDMTAAGAFVKEKLG